MYDAVNDPLTKSRINDDGNAVRQTVKGVRAYLVSRSSIFFGDGTQLSVSGRPRVIALYRYLNCCAADAPAHRLSLSCKIGTFFFPASPVVSVLEA